MYQDRDGVSHCLLVLGEGEEDGILVESEGSLYARYSALLPNARGYMQKQIQTMAEDLIKQGTAQTANGSWVIGFDEISQHFDTTVTPNNGIGQMLIAELEARDEVSEIIATEDCLEMTYYLENAPVTDDAGERLTTLFGLMGCNLEDVHILDADEEHDLATIVELNQHTLTEQGKRDWADVLGAKVTRIYDGYYGTQIEVTGCDPARLEAFSKMLAGECTLAESERWLNPESDDNTFELKYDDGGVQ